MVIDFSVDLIFIRQQVNAFVSTTETILDVCTRKLMQHALHHGELIEVGIQ